MKNYKKVIALLMAATMTTSLAACGGGDDGDNKPVDSDDTTTTTPTETPSDDGSDAETPGDDGSDADADADGGEEDLGAYTVRIDPATGEAYDLGGMEVIIRDWWSDPTKVAEPNSGYEEAQKEYRDWIQETYNFTIKEQSISGWGEVFEDLMNYSTTGGDDQNYVFTLRISGELVSQMASGLYYDISGISTIDLTEEKWDDTVTAFGTLDGHNYTFRKMSHEPRTGVYFNKRLLEENGIDPNEIYELQRNHEWTWDKFVEYLEKLTIDTDNDGVIDLYGFLEGNSLNDIAVASNFGNYIGRDANGMYTYELESENTIEALNWAIDIRDRFNKPNPDTETPDQTWDYFWNEFKAGNAVFLIQQEYAAGQNLSDMEDDFGFVAFPMGPKADCYVDLMQDNIHVLPACYDAERAEKIMLAYDLYYEPVPGYEDYSDYYAGAVNALRDMEGPEETLAFMCEKTVMFYHGFVPGIDLGNQLLWQINKDNTPAQQAESIRNSWQAYIDAANGVAEFPAEEEATE